MLVRRYILAMWSTKVASRLRVSRRSRKLGQQHVAEALEMSVSEVSRLERGVRGLRVDQLQPWARCLGQRVELVMWDDDGADGWDHDSISLLAEVAKGLPHLPEPARAALREQMRIWTKAAEDQD